MVQFFCQIINGYTTMDNLMFYYLSSYQEMSSFLFCIYTSAGLLPLQTFARPSLGWVGHLQLILSTYTRRTFRGVFILRVRGGGGVGFLVGRHIIRLNTGHNVTILVWVTNASPISCSLNRPSKVGR